MSKPTSSFDFSKVFITIKDVSITITESEEVPTYIAAPKCVSRNQDYNESEYQTIYTPVPTIHRQEFRRMRITESPIPTINNSSVQHQKSKRNSNEVEKNDTSSVTRSCHDFSAFRTSVPVRIYFMEKRIGSTELPCDSSLKSVMQFGLHKIGKKIKNCFSFYAFSSIYDVCWNRKKNALMKKPAPENPFRTILKPSMVNNSLVDIKKRMDVAEMNQINIYIFLNDLNDDNVWKSHSNSDALWKFHHVW